MRSLGLWLTVLLSVAARPARADQDVATQVGKLSLRGGYNEYRHAHGGAPARVGLARFQVSNQDAKPQLLEILGIELLHGHCREQGYSSRMRLRIAEALVDDKPAKRWQELIVPAGSTSALSLGFQAVAAYQGCDRFAFALRVRSGAAVKTIEAPLRIVRMEPLRPHHLEP